MKKRILLSLFILSVCATFSCTNNKNRTINSRVHHALSQITEGKKSIPLALTNVPEHQIQPSFILFGDSIAGTDKFLVNPTGIVKFKSHFYILDRNLKSIVKLDEEFKFVNIIRQEGRGPGELLNPLDLEADSNFIYIYDGGNLQLSAFNENFEFISSVEGLPSLNNKNISANNYFVLAIDKKLAVDNNFLLHIKENKTLITKKRAFPQIIPPGEQPLALNSLSFHSNRHGNWIAAYRGLPYLFYFDKDHVLNYYLELPLQVNMLDGESSAQFSGSDINGIQIQKAVPEVRSIFTSVILDDNENIFWHRGGNEIFYISNKGNTIKKFLLNTPYTQHTHLKMFLTDNHLCVTFLNTNDILFFDLRNIQDLANININ